MFGKYQVVSQIGRGNSSQVFLAEHTKLKAYRAIKCISKSHQPQFLLEADILKNLKHPGIPTIYDVEEDEKAYYIIEEYIQGQSLEAFALHQDCISIDTTIHIVLQICDVLTYLHNLKPNPVIYQDLKPEHIILCGERIVLVDFGIASYITENGNTFQNYGTKGYAPPEKYEGIACDARTDVYGIGIVLEFLVKKAPPEEIHYLKPLINKALAYSMEERYPSVEAFKEELLTYRKNGNQNNQPKQKKHLLKKIAVAGTQKRVGVTHIAIAMTCFFNQQNMPCVYQEHHDSECMRMLVRENSGYIGHDGLIAYEKFRGMPYYGGGIARQDKEERLYIQDYGVQLQDILEDDEKNLILVAGSRPWEMEQTRKLLEQVCFRQNLILICNYDNHVQAKIMAKEYHHRIYCFPLDANPFHMTREKRKFFKKLLLQEGW